jgi:tetratricopeptide (TPR) repeat protein
MRIHTFRGVLALAVLIALPVAPAFAQSVVRGTVVDASGKPVPDAMILFEAEGVNRKAQTKTDNKGEFLQVGLQSGTYRITASKEGIGTQTLPGQVRQGPNQPLQFTLAPPRAGGPAGPAGAAGADNKAQAEINKLAQEGVALMQASQHDQAIAKFNEVIAKVPNCFECYQNIGVIYREQKKQDEAIAAFKKVVELKPDHGGAYSELATIYNSQKKFDLAAEAGANAAKYLGGAGGGASAEASYNQGVILFNGGKFQEARTQFEAAVKADPNYSMAQYQLGMTALNLGDIPAAVAALEAYLKVDPNGPKAAEVKGSLPALQGMLKK